MPHENMVYVVGQFRVGRRRKSEMEKGEGETYIYRSVPNGYTNYTCHSTLLHIKIVKKYKKLSKLSQLLHLP